MNKYLTGTILIKENTYITKAFTIQKGIITKRLNNNVVKVYHDNETILLEHIDKISIYSYHIEQLTIGTWISPNLDLLQRKLYKQDIHLELLLLNDPLIKVSRYIYYKYLEKEVLCFYLDIKLKDLSIYLKIKNRQLSNIITYLIDIKIISKQNKLIIIENLNKLINLAFSKDISLN